MMAVEAVQATVLDVFAGSARTFHSTMYISSRYLVDRRRLRRLCGGSMRPRCRRLHARSAFGPAGACCDRGSRGIRNVRSRIPNDHDSVPCRCQTGAHRSLTRRPDDSVELPEIRCLRSRPRFTGPAVCCEQFGEDVDFCERWLVFVFGGGRGTGDSHGTHESAGYFGGR